MAGLPTLHTRVAELESAVLALAAIRLSTEVFEEAGHPFRGNQWTTGEGNGQESIMHIRMPGVQGVKWNPESPDTYKALGEKLDTIADAVGVSNATVTAKLDELITAQKRTNQLLEWVGGVMQKKPAAAA